ncbi:MAG: GIY-YIG nuclease family protein [Candidatus Gastranaerophilales bacterium]|nr:GIY-YIG nuclease family protein [Candidatus Gastranaerophilales bacterium]
MEKKYYTYIILTKDNTLYCGYTDNLDKRFEMHISGKGAKYTRSHKPLKIVYSKCFKTKSEAMKEERRIKSMTKEEKMEFIKKFNTN